MGDRPVSETAEALAALMETTRREFDGVAEVVADHVGHALEAVSAPGRRPGANRPGVLPRPVSRLPGEIAIVARDIAAVFDAAAAEADHVIEAEIRRLTALLDGRGEGPCDHPPEPVGRALPGPLAEATPPGVPVGRALPRPFAEPALPGVPAEPELPDGVEYAPVAFVAPTVVDIDLPRQGEINDCHVVASLCAVAHHAPGLLLASVRAHGDGVMVHAAGHDHRLAATLPVDGSGRLLFARSPDQSTLVPYLEKAYAAHLGGYPVIGRGGYPYQVLAWLGSRMSRLLLVGDASTAELTAVLSSGHPAVACSWPLGPGDPEIATSRLYGLAQGGHAYAVRGLDTEGRVLLHNPWGIRHPEPLPLDVFGRLFTRVDWCELGQ